MNILLVILSITCLFSEPQQENVVHLKGNLKEVGTHQVIMHYDGAASLIGNSRDIVLQIDWAGNFDTTFVLNRPEYFSICRNTLYLSPGDDLEMKIYQGNREAVFKGRGAAANSYLRNRLFPKNGSFLIGGSQSRENFEETKKYIDSLADFRMKVLDTLQQVTPLFKELERGRIIGDVLNSYMAYFDYDTEFLKLSPALRSEKMKEYVRQMSPDFVTKLSLINDERYLEVAVIREVYMYLFDAVYLPILEQIPMNARRKELYNACVQMNRLQENPSPELIKEIQEYIQRMRYPEFSEELKQKVAGAFQLLAGQPAIDFRLTTSDGQVKQLSDYRGKILYIDLWATWCGPCKEETPYFKTLGSKFSSDDILFIQINMDHKIKHWQNTLSSESSHILQGHSLDYKLTEGWKVFSIPRFILIDRDFRILDAYASRPSAKKTETLLMDLLERKD